MKKYDPQKIEPKWQKVWLKDKSFAAKQPPASAKATGGRRKWYSLIEFPYPSGDGLHVGHVRSNTAMDIISRKRRMEGFNVLYPIGYDAFGLPTENYAIKTGKQPALITKQNTDNFRKQLQNIGFSFDWSREINTTDPKYYKWTQWIFLQMFKAGLAYKKKMTINWCPKDKIGLANEEVINGCCERCGTVVEKREKEQWMLAITKYADRLDKDLDTVDYLPQIKTQQRNWIGRSEGAEINFGINPTLALPEGEGLEADMERGEYGYHTTDQKSWVALQERAVTMRKNPTHAENMIWEQLRKDLVGDHIRRQQIIGNFIVDFVCLKKKITIEIDGDIHDHQKKEDAERTVFLQKQGFKVIRFTNDEVENAIKIVIEKIKLELSQSESVSQALPFGEGRGGVAPITVFTTRPDTLFGVTFIAVSAEKAKEWLDIGWPASEEVKKYVADILKERSKVDLSRDKKTEDKTGISCGFDAINPANGEKVPVWIVNYVLGDVGTGAIMGVPAHDERDFEFAKKYKLPIKYVVAPRMIDHSNPHVEGKKTLFRKGIMAIVRNPKNGKVINLKWKKQPWTTFVMGGVEDGEDIVEAARREILEETGYKNLKFIRILGGPIQSEFFAAHKDVNRVAHTWEVLFELENEERNELSSEEDAIHEVIWVDPKTIIPEKMAHVEAALVLERLLKGEKPYIGEGIVLNSGKFDHMTSAEAKKAITESVGGKMVTTYKLRDWIFSRQRYWGEPIPLIHCDTCGYVAVPDKDLPVVLPKVKNYQPTDNGESPLANIKSWVNVKCPQCKGPATRETDTMPQWAGSSWYYLRYTDPKNSKKFADPKALKYWTPVDWYNGGMEHTTLHVLYSRFWHKFLYDQKLVPTSEPYAKRTSHGLILAKDGEKMSKSKGNVVNPDDIVKVWGADSLRLYEMFMGPFDQAIPWSTDNIIGVRRFLEKVWRLQDKVGKKVITEDNKLQSLLQKTIQKVSDDIEAMRFNTAVSAMMILVNELESAATQGSGVTKKNFETFLQLLSPFAPHISEEIWRGTLQHKKSIFIEKWPVADMSKMTTEQATIMIQINGKVRGQVTVPIDSNEEEVLSRATKDENVAKWLVGHKPQKVVYVKNRLINIVINMNL